MSGVDDLPDGYHYYGNPPKVTLDGGNIQVSKPSRPDKGTIAETFKDIIGYIHAEDGTWGDTVYCALCGKSVKCTEVSLSNFKKHVNLYHASELPFASGRLQYEQSKTNASTNASSKKFPSSGGQISIESSMKKQNMYSKKLLCTI